MAMSREGSERLRAVLFSSADRRLVNVRLFRGDAVRISPDDVVDQIVAIEAQRRGGLKPQPGPVRSGRPRVDIRRLVEELA